jgi:hypothetical protein
MSLVVKGGVWIGKKLASKLFDKFSSKVVERWSKYRRDMFFEAFCHEMEIELQQKYPSVAVEDTLQTILDDENKSEALFEAYRQVSLSKSKKIGPRIIGLLTAQIFVQDNVADADEELLFEIAEKSSDADLIGFANFYDEQLEHSKNSNKKIYNVTKKKNGNLEIVVGEESLDSTWDRNSDINLGSLNLRADYGAWALRFKNLGVLVEEIRDKTISYEEDSERHIDEPGTLRTIRWVIIVPGQFSRLRDLIVRANY